MPIPGVCCISEVLQDAPRTGQVCNSKSTSHIIIILVILTLKESFLCRAAVYFEMGEYEKCAADCDTAVEKGREARADYKIIARALTRKGNAFMRQDRIEEAIQTYQKSLTEHRRARK